MTDKKLIGQVYVDSGTVWVGDPCYVVGEDASHGVKDWSEFCNKLDWDANNGQYREVLGEGIGISIQTAYGDGTYPVYVEFNSEGRPSKVTIDFEPEYDEEDELV